LESSIQSQMDIERVNIKTTGKTLVLTLTMKEISDSWEPANGFDRLSLNIFFDLPQREGMKVLPQLFSTAPEQFLWDIGHVAYGWGNYLYNVTGASAETLGQKLGTAPTVEVNKASRTITFSYDGASVGVSNWGGSKIYISTWDSDGSGNYRALSTEGGTWAFGGGEEYDPRILDDISVIEIPFK